MPENDDQFAKEIEQIFIGTVRWGKRSAYTLAAGLVVAVIVGVVTWFSANPVDRDEIHSGLAFGLAGTVFFVVCMAARIFDPKPTAKCPKCSCDWNLECQHDSQTWLNWKCCPSCGLNLIGEKLDQRGPNS